MNKISRLLVLGVVPFLLIGCQTAASYKIHHSFLDSPDTRTPKKILLFPADVTVHEISAGGVIDKLPDESSSASKAVERTIGEYLTTRSELQLVEPKNLTSEDHRQIELHRALYDQVAGAAFIHTNGAQAWEHKRDHFDYTLGGGLTSLQQKTGADAAIVVVGQDYKATAGRIAASFFAAAFGVGMHIGHTFLTVGFVDLKTGDVLWFDYRLVPNGGNLGYMARTILEKFPGIESYATQSVAQK